MRVLRLLVALLPTPSQESSGDSHGLALFTAPTVPVTSPASSTVTSSRPASWSGRPSRSDPRCPVKKLVMFPFAVTALLSGLTVCQSVALPQAVEAQVLPVSELLPLSHTGRLELSAAIHRVMGLLAEHAHHRVLPPLHGCWRRLWLIVLVLILCFDLDVVHSPVP